MNTIETYTNNLAISLSFLCLLHCLAFPFIIGVLPSFVAMQLGSEAFHISLLVGVIPSSVYSLTLGCKQHRQYQLLKLGMLGLSFLVLAAVFGESVLGEFYEKAFTVIGASILAIGHYRNYRLCQQAKDCGCSDLDEQVSK